ncbi:linker for activation of T-cells family member 1 [Eleutherodactylus coqui]|uniref:linker for activation of T-cells family member 1 n=1 Tax=Eleutherodactylus coqui TaxID=57060 RepID=UPI0034630FA9
MMETFSVMYSVAFVLPIILITSLCIICRKKIPSHIPEPEYDDKPLYTPPSSFTILNRPSAHPRTVSSWGSVCPQISHLPIPRSPVPESRRTSVGREIKGAPILKTKSVEADDYDDEGGEPKYTNPDSGYIQVLPEKEATKHAPVLVIEDVDNRASLSSVGTDENYVNVGDSDDAKASSVDGNYVNVEEVSDSKGESLEYVNVEGVETQSSSITHESEDDDDMPEYENVEKGHNG